MKLRSLFLLWMAFPLANADEPFPNFDFHHFANENHRQRFAIDLAHPANDGLTLPLHAAGVRSLAVANDLILYGATESMKDGVLPVVFRFDAAKGEITGFVSLEGTPLEGQNFAYQITSTIPFTGTYADGETGHLLEIVEIDGAIQLNDLGLIKTDEGVFSLVISDDREFLYGTLYPSNSFFRYHIKSGDIKVFRETALSEEKLKLGRYQRDTEQLLSRALGLDRQGRVYGNTENGRIFRYLPETDEIELTDAHIAGSSYRRCVRSWVLADNYRLYGGTSIGGYLFELNPETLEVRNLGKPLAQDFLNGLIAHGNTIYGTAGEFPDRSEAFYFDYDKNSFGFFGTNWESEGTTRYWMLQPNTTSRGNGQLSQVVNLNNGWAIMAERDLLPSLLYFKLRNNTD